MNSNDYDRMECDSKERAIEFFCGKLPFPRQIVEQWVQLEYAKLKGYLLNNPRILENLHILYGRYEIQHNK